MAIFHFTVAPVSRGKGQSIIAKAAYNAREKLRDERTGEMKDYSRKDGLEFSGIFAPKDAPEWTHDRAALWNAVEVKEDHSTRPQTAQLARSIEVALPHELTGDQRRQLVTDFVREQFQRRGMIADVSIHAPSNEGDERNHHAHILLTMREITPEGFGNKVRAWNDRGEVERWREAWERTTNRYLERYGHEERIDRRTLEAQGIEREPTQHRGPHVEAMQRRGFETERGNIYRDTVERNATIADLRAELGGIEKDIALTEGLDRPANDNAPEQSAFDPSAMEGAARAGDKLLDVGIAVAGKVFDVIGDMFAPTLPPTKEEMQARAEASRDHAEKKIDLARYVENDAYRKRVVELERPQQEEARRQNEDAERRRGDRER